MSYSYQEVRFNTNPYAIGMQAGEVMTRSELKENITTPYFKSWYPRLAKFWKIPKGSRNIRFKIPAWYVPDSLQWPEMFLTVARSLHPDNPSRPTWLKNPTNLLLVAEQTARQFNIEPPDIELLYTMVDSISFQDSQLFSFSFAGNASFQVFHEDGKLLIGTPLTNWNVLRGKYWGFGYQGQGFSIGKNMDSNGNSLDSSDVPTADSEALWRHEGIWPVWYALYKSGKAGIDYQNNPTASTFSSGDKIKPVHLSLLLPEAFPYAFPSIFLFDDSTVNQNQQEVLKSDSSVLKIFNVEGEVIRWSGNVAGAQGLGSGSRMVEHGVWSYSPLRDVLNAEETSYKVLPSESLEIDEAQENLILGVVATDDFGVTGSWEEFIDDDSNKGKPYIRYLTPCPTTLRYHPVQTYQAPYRMSTFSCTDRLHKRIALYFPDQDHLNGEHIGCIEIRRVGDGTNTGGKKFYVDGPAHWFSHDLSDGSKYPVEVMDMSFGYDYQRLYVLFKQAVDAKSYSHEVDENGERISADVQHYRAWFTMYDTGLPADRITESQMSIPLYGFVDEDDHMHPLLPKGIDSVLSYIKEIGVRGELLNRPELDSAFNILSAHDKLFITIPCIFKPLIKPWDNYMFWDWSPNDARQLIQLMYMFDETKSTFINVAVIGSLSPWKETHQVPLPDIEPKRPFKLRMGLIDEMVYWTLADARVFPAEYYDPCETKQADNDNILQIHNEMYYSPNMWDATGVPNRFWQPLTVETILIDDLISSTMESGGQFKQQPVVLRGDQTYAYNPLITDQYVKAESTWDGQKVFGTRDHFLSEDQVVYHNFRRKILTGVGDVQVCINPDYRKTLPEYAFDAKPEWIGDPREGVYAYHVTLEPGYYHVYARGADGGYATTGSNDILASGGQGATVEVDFKLTVSTEFTVYAGKCGQVQVGGWLAGGQGGRYVDSEEGKPSPFDHLYDIKDLAGSSQLVSIPLRSDGILDVKAYFVRVPAGTQDIALTMSNVCSSHNASLQVFHIDGTLLIGTANTSDASKPTLWRDLTHKNPPTNEDITIALNKQYPGLIGGFDDSVVNEGMANSVIFNRNMHTFEVDGEQIQWTGNIKQGYSVSSGSNATERLVIAEAQEDLIIGVLCNHYCTLSISCKDMSLDPLTTGYIFGGGGGGLTGLFMGQTPIVIAGSGGGGGNPINDEIVNTEANGGHGGGLVGYDGTLYGEELVAGGNSHKVGSGLSLHTGESSSLQQSTAGGGGAGYYGGRAYQESNVKVAPGGGGGSSYVIGADGYASQICPVQLQIGSYKVTEGSEAPWANPVDGQVIITGYKEEPIFETQKDYCFINHDVGDFYYQCAGGGASVDKVAVGQTLNLIFLNDCTGSMSDFIWTLGGAMSELFTVLKSSKYGVVRVATVGYAGHQILIETVGDNARSFTQDADVGRVRMETISDFVIDRQIQLVEIMGDDIPFAGGQADSDSIEVSGQEWWEARMDRFYNLPLCLRRGVDILGVSKIIDTNAETWAAAIQLSWQSLSSSINSPNTMFVIVTDDIDNMNNTESELAEARKVCMDNHIPVVWVLPTDYDDSLVPDEARQLTIDSGGTFIKGMEVDNSNWGGKVARKIAESAPDPILMDDLSMAHVFSLENLSCHTSMKNVSLTSTKGSLKLSHLPPCNPAKYFGLSGDVPNARRLVWDEIPPASEAYFMVSYTPDTDLSIPNSVIFKGHSYRIIEKSLTWQEAKTYCETLGGHLADIQSQEEEDFIESLLEPGNVYFIGGYKADTSIWSWVTGAPWSFQAGSAFMSNQYLAMQGGVANKWQGVSATETGYVVCEWDFEKIPVPVSPTCESLQRGLKLEYYLESNVESKKNISEEE